MSVTQLIGWMQIVQVAIPLGIATIDTIKTWIRSAHGEMTDAQMNVVLALVIDDATRRKALALADATGQP